MPNIPSVRDVATGLTLLTLAADASCLPVQTAEASSPTLSVMADPGTVLTQNSRTAAKVAQCAFKHAEANSLNLEEAGLPAGTAEAAGVFVRSNGDIFYVIGLNMTDPAMPDGVIIEKKEGGEYFTLYIDMGLDGNLDSALYHNPFMESDMPYNSNRYANKAPENPSLEPVYSRDYATALDTIAAVCDANATPLPPIRGKKDCPNESMGVAALSKLYGKTAISVVRISGVQEPYGIPYNCTGYMVADGLIATARHCINQPETDASTGDTRFTMFSDIEIEWPARFDDRNNITALYMTHGQPIAFGTESSNDVALIAINPNAPQLHPLALSASQGAAQPLASFGHPLGADWTLSSVEGVPRTISSATVHGETVRFETPQLAVDFPSSCNVGEGNSGGPLLDVNGRVAGTIWAMPMDNHFRFWAVPASQTAAMLLRIAPNDLATVHAGLTSQPVLRCPVKEEPFMLTPSGPQYKIERDEHQCTQVATPRP